MTVVWSIVSGKCNVLADGQEVHVSNSRSGSISCSWTMKGNHVLQVIAHALSPQPPMRQYELLVDGQSFFEMPKVFHLGLQTLGGPHTVSPNDKVLPVAVSNRFDHNPAPYNNYSLGSNTNAVSASAPTMTMYPSTSALQSSNPFAPPPSSGAASSSSSSRGKNIVELEAPRNLHEEEVFLAEAIKNSLQESGKSAAPHTISPTVSKNEDLILNFFDDPAPPPYVFFCIILVQHTLRLSFQQSCSYGLFSGRAYVAAPPPSYDGGLHYHEVSRGFVNPVETVFHSIYWILKGLFLFRSPCIYVDSSDACTHAIICISSTYRRTCTTTLSTTSSPICYDGSLIIWVFYST